jgi:putative radical SAM enzyme (TIGR03279 family)
VVAVADPSPASRAGLLPGDEIRAMNGQVPRDVIEYQLIADEPVVDFDVSRGGLDLAVTVDKAAGEPLGAEISSAVFDQVRTCDNHCEFCFIYQLPKGMRSSLYLKDDDYRLSFLYGNFTTLTRFTEADLERVIDQHLSPLYVSIHATDPDVRARLLRNKRGALSLRWLRLLLDHGIEVHGQVVVCPGVNDGAVLQDTLAGLLDRFPDLATAALVPLGISRYTTEASMRAHTCSEAVAVVEAVAEWQSIFLRGIGRRLVYAADEYYLLAGVPFPPAEEYDGFVQHENGIGMARAFEADLLGLSSGELVGRAGHTTGFFQWVEGAPAEGYRAPRTADEPVGAVAFAAATVAAATVAAAANGSIAARHATSGGGTATAVAAPVRFGRPRHRDLRPPAVLTGEYGAAVLAPLLAEVGRDEVEIVAVRNDFFGGNIAVTGLMAGNDVAAVLAARSDDCRYLLPDVCLSNGLFLDGVKLSELPKPVEVVATDARSLLQALGAR